MLKSAKEDDDSFLFFLNNNKFKVQKDLDKLMKISDNVRQELFHHNIYSVQSKVTDKNFFIIY